MDNDRGWRTDASVRIFGVLPDDQMPVVDPGSTQRAEHALWLLHTHRGSAAHEIDRLLAEDPGSVAGHCLRAALIICSGATAAQSQLEASITIVEAASSGENFPAKEHAAAARAWLEQNPALALHRYGAIVVEQPLDILALVVAHALDFRLGRRRMLRDRIASVLHEWDGSVPGYASVLAMYAFGLVENGEHRRAEKMARRALTFDPGHPGAIHALAHVMEMQGRARKGLALLASTEAEWMDKTGFGVHLAWHRALFHLDIEDRSAALSVYDTQLSHPHASGMSALADASALLWRLQLRDMNVAGRWQSLADRWVVQPLTNARPFYTVHAMMAFAAAGRHDAVRCAFDALRATASDATSPLLPEETLARPLCEALLAFVQGRYVACTEWLATVRDIAHRCGGSLAQCDVIHLTYTEAALRARRAALARALVAERAAQKPSSRLTRRLLERVGMARPAMA